MPELPELGELGEALVGLATCVREKVLLAVREAPLEYSLVRRGADLHVSWYETGSHPEVLLLNRTVSLEELMGAVSVAAMNAARATRSETLRTVYERIAGRLEQTPLVDHDPSSKPHARRDGGAVEPPTDGTALAFGFSASIPAGASGTERAPARADVHAMLFGGSLWGYVHGKRVVLTRGPVLLAAQRMLTAARALVDAWDAERTCHVRLRAGAFHVAVRRERDGSASLTLGPEHKEPVTVHADSPAVLVLPILRLVSDLCRTLVSVDRAQSRNLRIRTLRDDVRALRRRLREHERSDGFVNEHPERFQAVPASTPPSAAENAGSTKNLRFAERWRIEIDELDASATFLCGDRIVVGTPRRTIAVSRDTGAVLWVKEGAAFASLMAGTTLVRVSPDGDVSLSDVGTGHTLADTRIRTQGAAIRGIHTGSNATPPALILTEGPSRLVSIDVRTGELRWRYAARGSSPIHFVRSGRLVVITTGDGCLEALDAQSGDVVWRVSDGVRFNAPAAIVDDTVVVTSGDASAKTGRATGIDLYRGEVKWRTAFDGAVRSFPLAAGDAVVVAVGGGRRGALWALEPSTGDVRWKQSDPGVGRGAECMTVDDLFVINTAGGRICALELQTGATRWNEKIAHPVADDVPRRLEPVLRGGALFVPAAKVHVLRPHDGSHLGNALPCDLIPDLIRVDERGWVYVAEESGHLSALAPRPTLHLVT